MIDTVSIIVPTFNNRRTIEKCLNSLCRINYPQEKLEIIVINDGSTDGTGEILKSYRIKVLNMDKVGPARARNIGVKISKGKFVAFTDADCVVSKDWLVELLKGFSDDKVAAVGGTQRSPEDECEFGKSIQEFLETMSFWGGYTKRFKRITEVRHNPSCNMLYRKDVFEKLNGFKEELWPGEDLELDYRVTKKGYRILYNPKAVVYHYRPDSSKGFAKMMQSYGCWAGGYLFKKHGFFRPLNYEPFLLTFFTLAQLSLILYNPKFGLSVFLIFLILPFIYFSLKFLQPKRAFRQYSLLFLTLIHWNLGFLEGLGKK